MTVKKTTAEIASIIGGRLAGNPDEVVTDVSSFVAAGPGTIAFYSGKAASAELKGCKASAVIVKEGELDIAGLNLIFVPNPQIAFAKAAEVLRPAKSIAPGISPKADVSAKAVVAESASIGPFAVIEEGARIGEKTVIYPGVFVGSGARIGQGCLVYPGVSIREGCIIGDRVIIHSNAVIGSDGFGFAFDGVKHFKIPQVGIVRIGNDVEIGACVTIDRAAIDETVIGDGTKIDNLVQIAHNVKIGPNCIIVAQAGIAGSARIGAFVQIAGQAGVNGHIEIGDGTILAAKAGATGDLPARGVYSGMPAIEHKDWLRAQSVFAKLPELKKRVLELEKRLNELGWDK